MNRLGFRHVERGRSAMRVSTTGAASAAMPAVPKRERPLVSELDHVIWSVTNLDEAMERLTRRMGFLLAEAPLQRPALRTATVAIGSLPVRLVEKADWQGSQPIGIAMRSELALTEVETEAAARGLNGSGIFMIAGHGGGNVACFLLSDIVAPGDPGLMVVQYMGAGGDGGPEYFPHGGSALGILPEVSAQVDVVSAASMARWRKVMGATAAEASSSGLVLRAGERDGIAALLLRAGNLWNLQTAWKDAGIDCAIHAGRLIVEPSQTGGLPIEVAEG